MSTALARRDPPPLPELAELASIRGPEHVHRLWQHVIEIYGSLPAPHAWSHLVGGIDELQEPGTPTTIQAGVAASIGLGPSYAREDHDHAVSTGTAVDLGEANAEGSGAPLARAAHVHKLLVRIAKAGATIGTRKRINFIDGANVSITPVDDAGSDEIDVTIAATGLAPADAEYIVAALSGGLTAERLATATATISWDFTTPAQAKASVIDDSITYAKIQNISAASRLLGRGSAAGAGDTQEMTVGNSLSISGTVLDTIQDIRTTAEPTFAGLTLTTEEFNLQSTTPANITAQQNNYNPGNGCFFRLTGTGGPWAISGFAGGLNGRVIILRNVGVAPQDLRLAHQSVASLAANRIITPTGADILMKPDETVELIYDLTTQRWQVLGPAQHNLLGNNHADTVIAACVRGDLVYGDIVATWNRLAIGGANTVLRTGGTDPAWGKVVLSTDVTGNLPFPNLPTGITNAAYVTIGADANLTSERALVGTANQVNIADGGANANVTLSTPQNIHTAAEPTFAGMTLTTEEWNTQATNAPQITADPTNNYNPGNGAFFRLDSTVANARISGITGGVDGRRIRIRNFGAIAFRFVHQNALSTAANRLILPEGRALGLDADELCEFIYDATTQRWIGWRLNDRVIVDENDNVLLNTTGGALATGATAGFTYMPSMAGAPTGAPSAITGMVPCVIDSTNKLFMAYLGGTWVAL